MNSQDASLKLPRLDPALTRDMMAAAGLKPLNPIWAKLEIVLGLIVSVGGAVLIRDQAVHDTASGAMIVLGLYLAGAGHRSHLYQSQNRQTAYLIQCMQNKTQ